MSSDSFLSLLCCGCKNKNAGVQKENNLEKKLLSDEEKEVENDRISESLFVRSDKMNEDLDTTSHYSHSSVTSFKDLDTPQESPREVTSFLSKIKENDLKEITQKTEEFKPSSLSRDIFVEDIMIAKEKPYL